MRTSQTTSRGATAATLIALVASCAAAQPSLVIPPGNSQPGGDGTMPSGTPSTQPVTVEVVPETAPPEPVRDHSPDALAVLEQAERAIADLQSFRATLTMTPTLLLKVNHAGTVEIIGRRSEDDPERWQIRITGPVTPGRADGPIDIDAAFDGNRVRFVDHEHELVGARTLPVRLEWDHFAVPAQVWEHELWTRPDPFAEIRGAERLTLEPRQTVDGVECEVVKGVLGSGQISHTIAIGAEDHLPRRAVERVEFVLTPGSPPMTGEYTFEYTRLEVDPDLADEGFELPVPDGYQDQDFPVTNPVGNGESGVADPKPPAEGAGDAASLDNGDAAAAEDGGYESGEPMMAALNHAAASNTGRTVPIPGVLPDGSVSPSMEGAPDFTLKDAAGATVGLADLRGKPAVLVFWGSWNPWAREMVNALKPVMEEAQDTRFLVLAVRERAASTTSQRFAALGVRATLLPGADEVAALYDIGAIPAVVVIDGQGQIQLRHTGYNADANPAEAVREALGLTGG